MGRIIPEGGFSACPKPVAEPKQQRKPMRKKSPKRVAYQASPKGKAAIEYMGLVRMLPCVACKQSRNVEAHHCFHDRYGQERADDFDTIPLCRWCHMEGPQSIHAAKASWKNAYGPDWSYIPATRQAIATMVDDLFEEWF